MAASDFHDKTGLAPNPSGTELSFEFRKMLEWMYAFFGGGAAGSASAGVAGGGASFSDPNVAPASNAAPITNDANFPATSRAIYVGATGDVSAVMSGGPTVVFSAVPAGVVLPIRATQVTSAGTTATNLVALW